MEKELNEVITIIQSHRDNAYRKINEELVLTYFEIGKYLSNKISEEKWGSKIVENISNKIMQKYPNLKGFSKRGLYQMIQFYETYCRNEIVRPLVAQLNWTNNLIILARNVSPTAIATFKTRLIDKKMLENKLTQLRSILENKYE